MAKSLTYFLDSNNMFFEGCGSVAIMENRIVVAWCVTTCANDSINNSGYWRYELRYDLKSFTFDITVSERQENRYKICRHAFLVDKYYVTSFLARLFSRTTQMFWYHLRGVATIRVVRSWFHSLLVLKNVLLKLSALLLIVTR